MYKTALATGCLGAMLSVVLGAFGAHYLKTIFSPELMVSFETGVRYQFYHSIALMLTGFFAMSGRNNIKWIYFSFTAGILLFSGSIYALCLLKNNLQIGLGGLGILTPIGGIFFMVGWLLLLISIVKHRRAN